MKFLIFLFSLSTINGLEHFKWRKSVPHFTNDNKDFVILKSKYEEPVYVALHLKKFPEPVKFSVGDLIKYYLYTTENPNDYQQLWTDDVATLQKSHFSKTKKTVLVVHGYMNNLNSEVIQSIKNNLLASEDVNVIGVDWSAIADDILYHVIAATVPDVGMHFGDFLNFLIKNGLSKDNIHLIGHSLGAHVCSFAARQVTLASGSKVARLTGLDPALPGFSFENSNGRITAGDASFVDCIHTCGGSLGFMEPICQVDFYPNGGTNVQPGCTWLDFGACSHGRSHEYFAESIENGHEFPALKCPDVPSEQPVDCVEDGSVMGYHISPNYKGIYYTQTNSAYPFAKVVKN